MAGIVRDEALLESAIGIPKLPYYRTTIDKAGALLRSLVKNHPFVDGNKRIAVVTTIGFLSANGYITTASDEDIVEFTLRLARSEPDMPLKDVVSWIRAHVQQTDSFLRAELDS